MRDELVETPASRRAVSRRVLLAASAGLFLTDTSQAHAPDNLDEVLEKFRTESGLPAMAAVVLRDGKPTAAAVGVRKHGDPTPVRREDRFHLGSCTKAMTAVLVAMLVEQGRLGWDTKLPEALPSLKDRIHTELRTVTVDHLLAHRAGLSPKLHPRPRSLAVLLEARRSPEVCRRERMAFLERALSEAPESAPGATYAYCNVGYVVLGAICEEAWNAPWELIIRKRLFDRLGMNTAGFGAMGSPGAVEQPWQHRLRDGVPVPVEPGAFADNPPELGPAATVHCSATDWGRFLGAVLSPGGPGRRLLRRETWARLLSPPFGGDYAGGWLVTDRPWGGRVLTHAGSNTLSFCVAWLAPEKRFGVAAMTNIGGETAARGCDRAAAAIIERHLT